MNVIGSQRRGHLSQSSCSAEEGHAKDGVTRRSGRIADGAIGATGWLAALPDAALYAAASAGWMQFGACREEDPELFFPIGSGAAAVSQAEAAKTVCGRCAVRLECLSYALRTRPGDGIWGGTTWQERCTIATAASSAPAISHRGSEFHSEPPWPETGLSANTGGDQYAEDQECPG
jgi:WhiB family transcriptional regulator, redox-sensing transcriptional regulator